MEFALWLSWAFACGRTAGSGGHQWLRPPYDVVLPPPFAQAGRRLRRADTSSRDVPR